MYISLLTLFAVSSIAFAATPRQLIATAIVTTKQNVSGLECWEFSSPFTTSTAAGTSGASSLNLANVSNIVYTVLPPRFNGGVHNAPAAQVRLPRRSFLWNWSTSSFTFNESCIKCADMTSQLVVFTSGLAHITLPSSSDEAWVLGGANGLIVAVDTTGTGHVTVYPSDEYTIGLQIPFEGGEVPDHTVLWSGPCNSTQLLGF